MCIDIYLHLFVVSFGSAQEHVCSLLSVLRSMFVGGEKKMTEFIQVQGLQGEYY